jgi:hypothetical protein
MKTTTIIFSFLFLVQISRSQNKDPDSYLSDFNLLVQKLDALYPLINKTISKEQFEINVADTKRRLSLAKSKNEATYTIQRFMTGFADVHAGVTSVFGDLGVTKILPFKVLIVKNELYIKNYPGKPQYNGVKINSIDNLSAKEILDSLKILYVDDGDRTYGFVIQPLFNSFYGAFIGEKDTFILNTDKGIISAPAVSKSDSLFTQLIKNSWEDYMITDHDYLKSEFTDAYYYLRFLSFDKKIGKNKIEDEFNYVVTNLIDKNIPNLIIDLRYNSGGDPYLCGRMIAQLSQKPFKIFERLIVTKPGKGVEKVDDHFEKVSNDKGLLAIQPAKNIYKGKIYIIAGPMTESTSSMFCKYLMGQDNVVFVGAETPGAVNYFCAHEHSVVKLPNTGLTVTFGKQLIELKKGSSDNEKRVGLIPENFIEYSAAEILSGKDKEMEWIVKSIEKK